jgi:hypothetical protein
VYVCRGMTFAAAVAAAATSDATFDLVRLLFLFQSRIFSLKSLSCDKTEGYDLGVPITILFGISIQNQIYWSPVSTRKMKCKCFNREKIKLMMRIAFYIYRFREAKLNWIVFRGVYDCK